WRSQARHKDPVWARWSARWPSWRLVGPTSRRQSPARSCATTLGLLVSSPAKRPSKSSATSTARCESHCKTQYVGSSPTGTCRSGRSSGFVWSCGLRDQQRRTLAKGRPAGARRRREHTVRDIGGARLGCAALDAGRRASAFLVVG